MVLHQDAPQFLVGIGGAKQNTIGHDHGRPAAGFEQLQE
jgi:hypothetical protein